MTMEEAILTRLRALSHIERQEILDFADFLSHRRGPNRQQKRRSVRGLCADLVTQPISAQEIDDARREIWGDFPRPDIV